MPVELFSKRVVTHKLNLRFFDLAVTIKSDSSNFINLFASMYRRFHTDGSSSTVLTPVEFVLITKPDNPGEIPILILDGEILPLSDTKLTEGYAYESIIIAIVTRIRSHLLIHAGVVSKGGKGVILAADAMHGKTTLVLELVRRGFKFLSDEMAAFGRADRQVYPFPRSLRVRRGTLELAGFPEAATGAKSWLGKLLLDIEEIKPQSMGEVVPIDHIVILQDPSSPTEVKQDNSRQELCVYVDRLNDTFLKAVSQIEGIIDFRTDIDCGYPLLKLRANRTTSVLCQIESLCREYQILVLEATKSVKGQPTFKIPARLKITPKSQVVMELLRRFQGGYKSELLLDEFGGSSSRLFMELSAIVGHANCYQLFVGPLHEMADLICDLVRKQ